MKQVTDMMLVGPAATAVLNRLINQPRRRHRPKNKVGRGVVPIFVPFVDSRLSLDSSFEDASIERVDHERHGDEAKVRFDRDMRRLAAREKLPALVAEKLLRVADQDGKLPILKDIRSAQKGRELYRLVVRSRCPAVSETESEITDTKSEIVHEPEGDTTSSRYVAEQDALEAEIARCFPTMYTSLFGGHHAADIVVGDVTHAQHDIPDFDVRMDAFMKRVKPIIHGNPKPGRNNQQQAEAALNNNRPARRDSERP